MLIVKPFIAEYGWELMRYQAHARFMARKHKTIVVYCQENHEYLYQDFTKWIVPIKIIGGIPEMNRRLGDYKIIYPSEDHPKNPYGDDEVLEPTKSICRKLPIKQDFIKLGKVLPIEHQNIVAIHARNTQHPCRNYPIPEWKRLIELIKKNCELPTIYSIGSKEGAHWIPNTIDYRDYPLEDLCNLLASAKVMLSPSSGPAHLASLCGCPHIVFTDDKIWRIGNVKGTNRQRYETIWNPLKTPCTVLDKHNWRPPVDEVLKHVIYYYSIERK